MRLSLLALLVCTSASVGQAVFAPPMSSPVAADPGGLLAGDLDGDGDRDLVITRSPVGGGVASVALNAGDGTFVEGQAIDGNGAFASTLDDLDGDGLLDLVMLAGGPETQPSIRFGNGDGTFAPEVLLPFFGGLQNIRTADIDADGDRDLVLGAQSLSPIGVVGDVSVLLNDGVGQFTTQLPIASFDGTRIAVGDMDGDGRDDVVIATQTGFVSSLSVALSLGGSFVLLPSCEGCAQDGSPRDLRLADVDGDGDLDVVALFVPFIGGSVVVSLNDGTGVLSVPIATGLEFMNEIGVADVDGDGLPELFAKDFANSGSPAPHHVRVARNLGGAVFGNVVQVTMGDVPGGLVVADFDGDGRADIAVADRHVDAVRVAHNATYGAGAPFLDLGASLAGTEGFPVQVAAGTLVAGSPLELTLGTALANGSALLYAGSTTINAPFKGGLFVPSPDVFIGPLALDGAGTLTLAATWPAGIPSGFEVFWQFWLPDAGAVAGFASTSAVRATAP